jgi:phosphatidylserine/phosphatidylglycerophosphate/cardiolipin synthase-like enzyme
MNIYLHSDGPSKYDNSHAYYYQGSNPRLLEELLAFIDNRIEKIRGIHLCMYLFNNPLLFEKLMNYARQGIEITVVSIPLEGYDSKHPLPLVDYYNPTAQHGRETKYSLAEKIYQQCIEASKIQNFNMYIFPHIFIRSSKVRPFSRGTLPYSLHTKSIVIDYDQSGCIGLTSSNLATRDEIKDQVLVLKEDGEADYYVGKKFFHDLITNSIRIEKFDNSLSYYDYNITLAEAPNRPSYSLFVAPFYENSPHRAADYLSKLINNAKARVYFCAQHISAYQYYEGTNKRPGILEYALNTASRGVPVLFLSQTFVDGNGDSHGQRRPANISSFSGFIKRVELMKSCHYWSNEAVHSKFIIVDDTAVITTCNFTPTEFIYLPNVNIEHFDNIPGMKYKGIFSEVGQFLVIKSHDVCEALIAHFNEICNRSNTYRHI